VVAGHAVGNAGGKARFALMADGVDQDAGASGGSGRTVEAPPSVVSRQNSSSPRSSIRAFSIRLSLSRRRNSCFMVKNGARGRLAQPFPRSIHAAAESVAEFPCIPLQQRKNSAETLLKFHCSAKQGKWD